MIILLFYQLFFIYETYNVLRSALLVHGPEEGALDCLNFYTLSFLLELQLQFLANSSLKIQFSCWFEFSFIFHVRLVKKKLKVKKIFF